jgi:hypothetical protein
MEICKIFEGVYAMRYTGQGLSEFHRLFKEWRNPVILEEFFNEHEEDLRSHVSGPFTIEDAIEYTIEDADDFEKRIKTLSETNDVEGFEALFRNLHKDEKGNGFSEKKAYGSQKPATWIRLYAFKIDDGIYCISGGAIKLTRSLQERKHTQNELDKLKICQDYFKSQGICDEGAFLEIEF